MSIGIKSKFQDRLLEIKKRNKKNKNVKMEKSGILLNNFKKMMITIPLIVVNNVIYLDNTKDNDEKKEYIKNNFKKNIRCDTNSNINNKIDNNKNLIINKVDLNNRVIKDVLIKEDKEVDVKLIEKKIINKIKAELVKMVNEYEIIMSDLYILKFVDNNDLIYDKCKKNIDEIKKMLCKIDKLKKKYDFLKDNYDFEYLLEYDDEKVVDNIINMKNLLTESQLTELSIDYKLLDVYKYLYLRIDKLQEKSYEYLEYKENKVNKLKEKSIEFDDIKKKLYNIDLVNDKYIYFVKEQEKQIDEINKKIGKINLEEKIVYKMKGANGLFFNSMKYLGLLMINPLKGLIPSIVVETLITKNIIENICKNIEYEEEKKLEYSVIDYSDIIKNLNNNIDDSLKLVDSTIKDIVNLKIKYNNLYEIYGNNLSEYDKLIDKINDLENKLIGNKFKMEIAKKEILNKNKENVKMLKKVNEMNKM